MLHLLPDWKRVLKRAWSIRFMALSCLFSGIEIGLPYTRGWFTVNDGVFGVLAAIATMLAFITRLLAQPGQENTDATSQRS